MPFVNPVLHYARMANADVFTRGHTTLESSRKKILLGDVKGNCRRRIMHERDNASVICFIRRWRGRGRRVAVRVWTMLQSVVRCGKKQVSHASPGLPGCPRTAMRSRSHSGAFPELTQCCLGIVTPVMNVPPDTFSEKRWYILLCCFICDATYVTMCMFTEPRPPGMPPLKLRSDMFIKMWFVLWPVFR